MELCTESFGDPADPPILLVMGLGASMLWWGAGFCRLLAGGLGDAGPINLNVLVAEIEGRCWRGLVNRFAAGNEPLRVLAVDTQVRELEQHPLRDCA